MSEKVLVDSNYIYALNDTGDKYYERALNYSREHALQYIVLDVVLVEVAFLLNKNIGANAVTGFLNTLVKSDIEYEMLSLTDVKIASEIKAKYPQFDFVDCCIMALAERLEIPKIATFDRRHFGQYRPVKFPFLELLP